MNLIQKKMWRALFALALSFCLMKVNPVRADVFFSNLGQSDSGSAGFNGGLNYRLASDFLTDGTPRTITNITARLANSSTILPLTLTLSIYTDNGSGKPDTLVSIFDTTVSVPANGSGNYTAASSGISLNANTPYWVVGQLTTEDVGGTLTWNFDSNEGADAGSLYSTVPGTELMSNGGLVWVNNGSGNLLFNLEGITPAPEPGTLTLLALGAATIAGCGWQRRRAGCGRNLS